MVEILVWLQYEIRPKESFRFFYMCGTYVYTSAQHTSCFESGYNPRQVNSFSCKYCQNIDKKKSFICDGAPNENILQKSEKKTN